MLAFTLPDADMELNTATDTRGGGILYTDRQVAEAQREEGRFSVDIHTHAWCNRIHTTPGRLM